MPTTNPGIDGVTTSQRKTQQFGTESSHSAPPPEPPPLWPEHELQSLRIAVCATAPPNNHIYWKSNNVWVGCTEINACTSYEPRSAVRNLEIHLKVVGRQGCGDIWAYYLDKDKMLRDLISQCISGGRIQAVETRITKGSVEIILIVAILALAVSLAGLFLSVLQAIASHDRIKANFHDWRADCKAYIDKLKYRLSLLFGDFGGGEASSASA